LLYISISWKWMSSTTVTPTAKTKLAVLLSEIYQFCAIKLSAGWCTKIHYGWHCSSAASMLQLATMNRGTSGNSLAMFMTLTIRPIERTVQQLRSARGCHGNVPWQIEHIKMISKNIDVYAAYLLHLAQYISSTGLILLSDNCTLARCIRRSLSSSELSSGVRPAVILLTGNAWHLQPYIVF